MRSCVSTILRDYLKEVLISADAYGAAFIYCYHIKKGGQYMNTLSESFGFLRVSVSSADQTIPVEGALVYIYSGDNGTRRLLYSLVTDSDGITDTVTLPAPPLSASYDEEIKSKPYTDYMLLVRKNGYAPVNDRTVPIFPGTTSLQRINLIPTDGGENER